MDVPSTWWESFFEGLAVEMWLHAVPPEHTEREAQRLSDALGVGAGGELLDVPCGAGRLSRPLAARGYRMTAVDWSVEMLQQARSHDASRLVAWERRDMRDLPWPGRFDGAFCVGNSFGYLDDEGNEHFLQAVAAALKPGGRFVLETPMVVESLLTHIQDRPWWPVGKDGYLLAANRYDPARSRLEIDYAFIKNGRVETRRGSHRAYSYRQLTELLVAAGFVVEALEPWTRQAHSTTFIATRRDVA